MMRHFTLFLIILFISASYSFSPVENCNNVPALNKKIITFVKTKVNKKVGRGECWDLAAEALNTSGAKWDHDYNFGKEINPSKECVFPGDIIQFEGVEIEYWDKNVFYHEDLLHHTAIVFEVMEKGKYVMAEQNTATHGRKVSLDPLDVKNITKGKIRFYRPQS